MRGIGGSWWRDVVIMLPSRACVRVSEEGSEVGVGPSAGLGAKEYSGAVDGKAAPAAMAVLAALVAVAAGHM